MRARTTRLLAALFVAGLATVVLAQGPRPGGGFGQMDKGTLLQNKSVQEELKLTADQNDKLKKFAQDWQEKQKDELAQARQDKDRAKMQELRKAASDAMGKFMPDVLKPEQIKRLSQIEVQVQGIQALTRPEVQKQLDLSDKQKEEITSVTDKLRESRMELFKDIGKDKAAREEAMKKFTTMGNEAKAKAIGVLNDDQKKTWKDLNGAPFEIKFDMRPKKTKDD